MLSQFISGDYRACIALFVLLVCFTWAVYEHLTAHLHARIISREFTPDGGIRIYLVNPDGREYIVYRYNGEVTQVICKASGKYVCKSVIQWR